MNWGSLKAPLTVAVVIGAVVWSENITAYNPPPGPVHVVYWEKWGAFEAVAMQKVVDSFNASQSRIHVDFLSISGINSKTLLAIAGGQPPDIAGLDGPHLVQYADDQALTPLDDMCRAAGITRDQYIPAYIHICDYNGHLWALPSCPASIALHYNVDMLQAAGISSPPKTIEELDADSDRMYERNPDGSLKQAGFIPEEPGWWNWSWVYFFGGSFYDGHGKITATRPENIRAFEWIASFAKKYGPTGLQTFRGGFGGFNSPQNAFMEGQDAMEVQGVWMANFIKKNNPKLHWGAVAFPYPADRPDLANGTVADLDILTIPTGARHPKEAFEFIKYVQTQKAMEMLVVGQDKNSPLRSTSPGFYEHHPNPRIELFNDLPKGKNVYSTPQIGTWAEMQDAIESAVQEVALLQKTPKEALQEVQDRMQPDLDEHLDRLRRRGFIK
jgi:ABC-type glycerol-3-phosphate transport system substrate-binding protein